MLGSNRLRTAIAALIVASAALAPLPARAQDAPAEPVAPAALEPVAPAALVADPSAPPVADADAPPAPPTAAAARRTPRVIKIDDVKVEPGEHVGAIAPIDTAIVLNLKKIEKEPERRWSLHLSFGAAQTNLETSVARGELMEAFGRAAICSLQAGGLEIDCTDEGPSDPNTGLSIQGDIRYKVNALLTLEAEVGNSSAQTFWTQPGFRFDEKARIMNLSAGALFTLPWRVWRFGFYGGGGGGFLLGRLTSQFFVPSFSGVPFYQVSTADGNSSEYHIKGGGEVYIARFVSLTIEGKYLWAKIDDLEYSDDSSLKAINETTVPVVWDDFRVNIEQQEFGWFGDLNRPIKIDFTGASLAVGLRYHF